MEKECTCILCNGKGKIPLPNGATKPCECKDKHDPYIMIGNRVLGPNSEWKIPTKVEHSILNMTKVSS
jgi:hypothetical protein